MTDLGDRFRIVANDHRRRRGDRGRCPGSRSRERVWRPRPDLPTAVEAWLTAGGAHHTVLTRAFDPEPLIDFAEMAGIELLLIDETLDLPAFRNEIRWNQAYHHLARGL